MSHVFQTTGTQRALSAGPHPSRLTALTGLSVVAAFFFCMARAWALRNVIPTCDAGVYVKGALDHARPRAYLHLSQETLYGLTDTPPFWHW